MSEKENTSKEIELEFKTRFPNLPLEQNQELFKKLFGLLADFITPPEGDEIYLHMIDREVSKDISLHIADVPQGPFNFEEWFNNSVLSFSTNVSNVVKSTISEDKLAGKLFDDKDIKSFSLKKYLSDKEKKELTSTINPFFKKPENDLLLQSHSAMCFGANNTSQSLLKLWAKTLKIEGEDIQEIIDKAKKIYIERTKATKDSLNSNNKKHSNNRLIRSYAIKRFTELKSNSYKTNKEAAELIIDDVIEYSLISPDVLHGAGHFKFYNADVVSDRPLVNVRKWIGEHKNSTSKTK